MSHTFLEKIRPSALERVSEMPEESLVNKHIPDFCSMFSAKPSIISEIKFHSPSKGKIYNGALNHIEIGQEYLQNGAMALSVLTEPNYFKGDVSFIKDIRAKNPQANILLKDFVLDKKQITQAFNNGANGVLLIVAFLNDAQLQELHSYALGVGMIPLVEIHSNEELERALAINPRIIGVNNRNLKTLQVDSQIARELIKQIPEEVYAICESGVKNAEYIVEMESLGFDGFLIGESFMCNEHPGVALAKMINDVNKISEVK